MNTRVLSAAILLILAGAAAAREDQHQEPDHAEHTELEAMSVSALPFGRSKLDSAQPIDLLAGEKLDDRRGVTIGETLMKQPGVHSSYYGPGAGRPIIRGLGGPRVRVLEDGLSAADASTQSDDHAVGTEPMLIDRIEILRGPSTLLYGSGAIGGVVNVIDGRIPERAPLASLEGRFELRGDTVAGERTGVLRLDGGGGNWAWHFDGSWRDADDYRIPVPGEREEDDHEDEPDHEAHGSTRLGNSFVESRSGAAGLSWIGERGFIGASFKVFNTDYGIPAPHAHEEDHDDFPVGARLASIARTRPAGEEEHEEDEEQVFIDLEQQRWDLKGGLNDPLPGFDRAALRLGYNDYTHAELPVADDDHAAGEALTVFNIDAFQSRLELEHLPVSGWRGAIGAQLDDESLTALGEEAFVPSGDTQSYAVFVLEEKEAGALTWTLGARVERNRVAVDEMHNDDEHEAGHEPHDEEEIDRRRFTTWSASAGALWQLSEQWQASLNYSRAQRAPSQTELFANGPHAATFTFERGDAGLVKETTDGWDLIVHRHSDLFDFEISAFYNNIDEFIFLEETGEIEHGLPLRQTLQGDAEFYGMEVQGVWHVGQTRFGHFDINAGYDLVRGRLDDGRNLPRVSPQRFSLGFDWHRNGLRGGIEFQRVRRQDRVSVFEDETPGYNMVDARLSYHFALGPRTLEAFVRASNLLDEEARVHTSFLKNFAPLPGRNYTIGLRGHF